MITKKREATVNTQGLGVQYHDVVALTRHPSDFDCYLKKMH